MWPILDRRKRTENKIEQSVAYDSISKDSKIDNLVMLYDEATILLFEKPKSKQTIKKV